MSVSLTLVLLLLGNVCCYPLLNDTSGPDALIHDTLVRHFDENPDWLIEGDIIIPPTGSRKAIPYDSYLWRNKRVDYRINPAFPSTYKSAIEASVNHWREKTCLDFVDQSNNGAFNTGSDHIYFTQQSSGCYSYVGRTSGRQVVNIVNGCQYPIVIIHEIGHAIGFFHEQSRSERDDFVRILYHNIVSSSHSNFRKTNTRSFGTSYDYTSIMHYDSQGFWNNPYEVNTIQSSDPRYQFLMGSSSVLSFVDRKMANAMYSCASDCTNASSCLNNGFMNKDCICECPEGTTGSSCETTTSTEPPVCGGEVTTPGILKTPLYPTRATTWQQRSCVYIIKAPVGQKVRITFNDFHFHYRYGKCYYEKVEVRLDGVYSEGAFKCGNELFGTTHTSVGNEIVILIDSYHGSSIIGKGFSVTVEFIDDSTTVEPTNTTLTTTVISSTTATIEPTTTMQPTTTYTMEPTTTIEPTNTTMESTTTYTMEPTTTTESTTASTGEPTVTAVVCGEQASVQLDLGDTVIFTTPNFPTSNYPNNYYCELNVKATNPQHKLKLNIDYLATEYEALCSIDYFGIMGVGTSGTRLRACGYIPYYQYLLRDSEIVASFTSNGAVTSYGFKVRFTAVTA